MLANAKKVNKCFQMHVANKCTQIHPAQLSDHLWKTEQLTQSYSKMNEKQNQQNWVINRGRDKYQNWAEIGNQVTKSNEQNWVKELLLTKYLASHAGGPKSSWNSVWRPMAGLFMMRMVALTPQIYKPGALQYPFDVLITICPFHPSNI